MATTEFGKNISSYEKQFLNNYITLLNCYGDSSDFPISDEEKKAQYETLMLILNKLNPEEKEAFNKKCNTIQMQHLRKNDEHSDSREI